MSARVVSERDINLALTGVVWQAITQCERGFRADSIENCRVALDLKNLTDKQKDGTAALDVMEGHLKDHDTFVGAARLTIADIALYAYTHVAGEGGFDLSRYPAIEAWGARVAGQPGYVWLTAG